MPCSASSDPPLTVYENRGGEVWERHADGRRELFAEDIIRKLTKLESQRNAARKFLKETDYILPENAPRDRKILGFFEDFGWYPAAWSADDSIWKAAKCVGLQGVRGEEPEWNEVSFNDADLCWWREWPSNRWQDNPHHWSYGANNDSSEQNTPDQERKSPASDGSI